MAPMIGRTIKPGMIHSDPTEKPIDLARGGSASERVAKMPGPRMARDPLITMFAAMATARLGASGNTTTHPDPAHAAFANRAHTWPGHFTNRPVNRIAQMMSHNPDMGSGEPVT